MLLRSVDSPETKFDVTKSVDKLKKMSKSLDNSSTLVQLIEIRELGKSQQFLC